jgi:hypothetical protein
VIAPIARRAQAATSPSFVAIVGGGTAVARSARMTHRDALRSLSIALFAPLALAAGCDSSTGDAGYTPSGTAAPDDGGDGSSADANIDADAKPDTTPSDAPVADAKLDGNLDAPATDAPPPACTPIPQLSASCNGCLGAACCDGLGACETSPDCMALALCLGVCGSPGSSATCAADCYAKHPNGKSMLDALLTCDASSCRSECEGDFGPVGAAFGQICFGVPQFGTTCNECLTDSCCLEIGQCEGDPACAALSDCVGACGGDAACVNQCVNAHPTGLDKLKAVLSCDASHCASDCAGDLGWLPSGNGCYGVPGVGDSCNDCLTSQCCGELGACMNDDDCIKGLLCLAGCNGSTTCALGCIKDHFASVGNAWNLLGCLQPHCASACGTDLGNPMCTSLPGDDCPGFAPDGVTCYGGCEALCQKNNLPDPFIGHRCLEKGGSCQCICCD